MPNLFTPANTRGLYVRVMGVTLIPQDNAMACWYASTMMMYTWYVALGGKATPPSDIPEFSSLHRASNGLPWATMTRYAQAVGMRPKPLASPTIALLAQWLRAGPLWTDGIAVDWSGGPAGTGHVVVVAGLREVPNSNEYEIYVYDPWPVSVGHEGWRPISHLVTIMLAGADPRRQVTFLSY